MTDPTELQLIPTIPTIHTVAMRDVVVPDLEHDATMLEKYQSKVHADGRLERRIVAALYAHMALNGWSPSALIDSDQERTSVKTCKAAMELIFNLDDAYITFRKGNGRERWIRLILGNGSDIVSDYGCSEIDGFDAVVDAFNPEDYE